MHLIEVDALLPEAAADETVRTSVELLQSGEMFAKQGNLRIWGSGQFQLGRPLLHFMVSWFHGVVD